jgi:dolichyldiphosphatase
VGAAFATKLLKRALNAARPPTARKADPGMPSSHAQSLFYLGTYVAIRVVQGAGGGSSTVRVAAAVALTAAAAALTALRVRLGYHTLPQVVAGAALGGVNAAAWAAVGTRWALPAVAAAGPARLALAGATGAAVLAFGWVNVRVWAEERRRRRGAV